MSPKSPAHVIAIVGGGFSGAATALHFSRRHGQEQPARIVVFEPRDHLGAGLAYSTTEPAHRVNVPAGKMTLYPDSPDSFLDYIGREAVGDRDDRLFGEDGLPYPKRSTFGAYVSSQLGPLLAIGAIEHEKAIVTRIERHGSRWRLKAANGTELVADAVVLAVSHPAPTLPERLVSLAGHPKLVEDLTVPNALQAVADADRVLILGNGLTSADVVASLADKGHRGTIVAISRRGLRSRGHARAPVPQEPFGDFVSEPSQRASVLLRRVRLAVKAAAAEGLSWHAVLDAVRSQGQSIWQALPVAERRRIARFVRPYWDVHRFRIAPQIENILDDAIAQGRLTILAASLKAVVSSSSGFDVELRQKGHAAPTFLHVDAILVTTGPAHGGILGSQPFLAGLKADGLLCLCETGLGLACNRNAVALSGDGRPVEGLFIVGPLARGTFGELMGLPQVTEHAVFVADRVFDYLASARATADLSRAG